jgi:hypothetical protein
MQTPGQPGLSRRGLADFFGLKRNIVILFIAIFIIGADEELVMRFLPKYLQDPVLAAEVMRACFSLIPGNR